MDPITQVYKHLDGREVSRFQTWEPRPPRFNPSSINDCSRKLWYAQVGTKPDGPGKGFLSLYGPSGDYYHDQVRFDMRDAGCELGGLIFHEDSRKVEETDVARATITHNDQEFVLSGRGDGRIKIDGDWYYLEIKSVDAYKMRWMEDAYRKGRLMKYMQEKWAKYFSQTNMMCAPEMLDLKGTYLVMVNRSNCQYGFSDKDFTKREGGLLYDFDPEQWEQQKIKMAMITKRRHSGVAPVRGHAEGSKDCGYCPFSERCWGV